MWKTRAVPRDGEPFAPSNRAPPSNPGSFWVSLRRKWTKSRQKEPRFLLVTVWEYVLSGGSRNNKKRRKTTAKRSRGRVGNYLQLHHQKEQMWSFSSLTSPCWEKRRSPFWSEYYWMPDDGPFSPLLYWFLRLSRICLSRCYDHRAAVSHQSPASICSVINLSICGVLDLQVWCFFTARCSIVWMETPQCFTEEH